MYSSVGEFIRALEAAGELQRITVPVSRDLEITEITDRQCKAPAPRVSAAARTFDSAHCEQGGKALLFDGYTSVVTLPGEESPSPQTGVTLSGWVALGASRPPLHRQGGVSHATTETGNEAGGGARQGAAFAQGLPR